MKPSTIHCPGGRESQTGTAVCERYQDVEVYNCGGIPAVLEAINSNPGPYTVPIWNSNQGEIKAAEYVWDLIEQTKIKIFDIWPKRIEFWYITKAEDSKLCGKIGSVVVAKSQCSNFLLKKKSTLEPYGLTTDAFEGYKNGDGLDGVLLAPGQGENVEGFIVSEKETANPNNFTSFVTLTSFNENITLDQTTSWLTGVTMGSLGESLDEYQQSFLEEVFSNSMTLNDIPSLMFVFKRDAKVGLLFEGEQLSAADFLDAEELEAGEITIHENVGELASSYSNEVRKLVDCNFPDLNSADFLLHRGENTVLFACPALGMYTHGYEEETVESIVRLYIDRIFEFISSDGVCSDDQRTFFERYQEQWLKQRSKFMDFEVID